MSIKYKFTMEWTTEKGWRAFFGTKRMWNVRMGFIVADYVEDKDDGRTFKNHSHKVMCYENQRHFESMEDAFEYMRTGDDSKAIKKDGETK